MSSPYVKLGNRSLEQWKVTELREELKKRKLTTKGLKEDLIKRLDEAVRTELQSSMENVEGDENEPNQSELPSEQAKTNSDVPGGGKDFMDVGISMDEKTDAKPEHESNDHRSLFEGKVDVSLEQGAKVAAELGGGQDAQVADPKTTVVINETVETVVINETVETVTVVTNNDGFPHAEEDANVKLSDTQIQLPAGGPDLKDSGIKDEDGLHSTGQMHQQDPSDHPLKYQVSEVAPDLGFHVSSDSVSTESVSIIEKNELKVDVITDNVQLDLDVKHEMAQPLPSSAVPDGDESHHSDAEDQPNSKSVIEDALYKKNSEESLDKKDMEVSFGKKDVEWPLGDKVSIEDTGGSNAEMDDSLQDLDREDLVPEKLNLDRSSGDDSMEEDIVETKPMEDQSNSSKIGENVGKSRRPIMREEDHVDVVGHDKPVETKPISADNETVSASTLVKRKFHDKAAVGNSDTVKKARRWNAEGLKGSELQNSVTVTSTTPKGSSEPTFKPFSGTIPAVHEETSKERIVPPPSRPPTNALRIDRFLRPFTLKQVQELLGKSGTVTGFWMDHIKTHCYVSYSSVEEAVGTRNAVYNLQWPTNGGRLLVAEFVDPQDVKTRVEAPLPSPATPTTSIPQNHVPPQPSPRQHLPPPPPPPLANPPLTRDRLHREALPPPREYPIPARERLNLPPPPPLPEKAEPPIVTLDDLFQKTKAIPRIYYLPLSDEQVAAKTRAQENNIVNQ